MRYKVIAFLLLILTAVDLAEAQQAKKVPRIGFLSPSRNHGTRDFAKVCGNWVTLRARASQLSTDMRRGSSRDCPALRAS